MITSFYDPVTYCSYQFQYPETVSRVPGTIEFNDRGNRQTNTYFGMSYSCYESRFRGYESLRISDWSMKNVLSLNFISAVSRPGSRIFKDLWTRGSYRTPISFRRYSWAEKAVGTPQANRESTPTPVQAGSSLGAPTRRIGLKGSPCDWLRHGY